MSELKFQIGLYFVKKTCSSCTYDIQIELGKNIIFCLIKTGVNYVKMS